jgi:tetratricopeptide (TPR) repeat protein
MICKNCKKDVQDGAKFCTACGSPFTNPTPQTQTNETPPEPPKKSNPIGKIISAFIFILVIGFGIYGSISDNAIDKNNNAIDSLNAGDTQTAISQLQEAKEGAVGKEDKINILVNLGYVYESEGNYDEAKTAFTEAQSLAISDSSEYFLISAELALLENDPESALANFNKALELKPNDFQINNSLSLFYLDSEELFPEYEDFAKALAHAKVSYENDDINSETSKQNLALAHFYNENYQEAIDLYSTTNLTEHPFVNYWLGLSHLALDNPDKGLTYLQAAKDAGVELPDEINDYLD